MSIQNQKLRLDLHRVFNMDNLPIGFASLDDRSLIDRAAMANAIKKLAEMIWKKGGFRFRHRKTHWNDRTYIYYCSQDAGSSLNSVAQGRRDAPQIERFRAKVN